MRCFGMIIIDNKKIDKCNKWEDNSIYVLTDFDRTITSADSYVSWDILSKNNLVNNDYLVEVKNLYNYYRPIEINESLSEEYRSKFMVDWWNEEIKLFIKHGLNEDIINEASTNMNLITFRNGGKEILKNMKDRNIPVIIISAGIGNFIEKFLEYNDCYYDNIYVLSNFLKFNEKRVVGFHGEVIHSLNKNVVTLPNNIKDLLDLRNNIILMGDNVADVNMAKYNDRNDALKIGFLEENIDSNKDIFLNNFDVVSTNNTSFNDLSNIVKVLKR